MSVLSAWPALYSAHRGLQIALVVAHVGAIFVAGGIAVVTDLAALRLGRAAAEERERVLAELRRAHRPVLGGLAVAVPTGVLLLLADAAVYLASPVLWVKLALIALLLANGALIVRAEGALRAGRGPADAPAAWLRRFALASMSLWALTALLGLVLGNAVA